jgi:hypothetical protein
MNRIEKISLALVLLAAADPVFAGGPPAVPAPVAGLGLGAMALIGLGYRVLKGRINR